MATTLDLFLRDTNVFLRWADKANAHHAACFRAVERLTRGGGTPCVVPQNLVEMWNVLTRPEDRNGFGLRPIQAEAAVIAIESRFHPLEDVPEIHRVWRRLVVEAGVSGVKMHDARLAACMLVHGVGRIPTFNAADFARYKGIEAPNPSDAD